MAQGAAVSMVSTAKPSIPERVAQVRCAETILRPLRSEGAARGDTRVFLGDRQGLLETEGHGRRRASRPHEEQRLPFARATELHPRLERAEQPLVAREHQHRARFFRSGEPQHRQRQLRLRDRP